MSTSWRAGAYWAECIHNGTLPDQSRDETDFWRPDLPGRRGFEFAAAALSSKVTPVVGDFQHIDLDELGEFDVVLYLGVLYHMKEPLTCLERLRTVTTEVAVIETEAVHLNGLDHEALLQFHAGSSLRTDFGNWYVPTIEALHNLCRAAGFSDVRTVVGPRRPARAGTRDCGSRWGAGSGASRRRSRRRRVPITAPSSTRTREPTAPSHPHDAVDGRPESPSRYPDVKSLAPRPPGVGDGSSSPENRPHRRAGQSATRAEASRPERPGDRSPTRHR